MIHPARIASWLALAGLLLVPACSRVEVDNASSSEVGTPADGVASPGAATPASDPAALRVEIDASTTYQSWEGAGASLQAWDADARAQYRSEAWQRLFLDDLGMTVLRIDLMPTPLYPHGRHDLTAFRFGPELEANVARFDYDRSPRAAIFGEVASDLVARGAELRVLASVWTPPHFMKDGARLTNNGNDSASGRLRMGTEDLEQYARYMAAAVTAWERRFGVPIYALSIQNEPRFEQAYSSMAFTPQQYATALAAVAGELDRLGMPTRLFGPEDVGYGPEGDHSRLDQQLAFIRAIMADPKAGPALDAFAIHGYGGDGIDSRGYVAPGNWKYYRAGIEEYGKPSWQTESGGGPPEGLGPVYFANVIFEGMSYGQVSLWCNWLLSHHGPRDQHTLAGFDLDTDHPKYAVAKHYFRFVRPGDRRLRVEPFDEDGLRIVAWQAPDGDHLSVVLINLRDQPATVALELGAAGQGRALRRWQTSSAGNFVELPALEPDAPRRTIELPATSLTTLSDAVSP